jgi:hypothetical protein
MGGPGLKGNACFGMRANGEFCSQRRNVCRREVKNIKAHPPDRQQGETCSSGLCGSADEIGSRPWQMETKWGGCCPHSAHGHVSHRRHGGGRKSVPTPAAPGVCKFPLAKWRPVKEHSVGKGGSGLIV